MAHTGERKSEGRTDREVCSSNIFHPRKTKLQHEWRTEDAEEEWQRLEAVHHLQSQIYDKMADHVIQNGRLEGRKRRKNKATAERKHIRSTEGLSLVSSPTCDGLQGGQEVCLQPFWTLSDWISPLYLFFKCLLKEFFIPENT